MSDKGKLRIGPVNAVPCPSCKKHMDCREVMAQMGSALDQQLDTLIAETGARVTSPNPTLECDFCGERAEIVRVDRRPRLVVKVAQ